MLRHIFIILLVIAFLVGCAGTSANIPKETPKKKVILMIPDASKDKPKLKGNYTYDGRLDPAMFNRWSPGKTWKERYGVTLALKNPRKHASIPYALVYFAMGQEKLNIPNGTIFSFAYIEDGKVRFFLNIGLKGHYKEMKIPEKQVDGIRKILEGFVGK